MINGGPGLLIPPSTRRPSASDRPPLKVAPAITAPHSPSVCTQSSGGGDAVGADYTPRSQHSASETARPAGQELRVTTSRAIRGNGRGSFPSHTFCRFRKQAKKERIDSFHPQKSFLPTSRYRLFLNNIGKVNFA